METTTKPDGTKVQTEIKKNGTKVETTTAKDGSTSKTTTNPNGSSVTENKAADGSTGTVKTDKHGQTTAETQLSGKAIEDAKKNGKPVKTPVEVEANQFGVGRPMTRGMVNTVLARLAGVDITPAAGQNWYDKGIAWARENGVSDGTNPNGNVTREQLATMLYRYAGSPAVSGSLPFSDAGSVSDYAQNALIWATQNGILNGYADGRVVPAANSQRSQVAAMMARFIQNAQ